MDACRQKVARATGIINEKQRKRKIKEQIKNLSKVNRKPTGSGEKEKQATGLDPLTV